MAAVAFRADLKLATATLEAIDLAIKDQAEDGFRPHLGASQIGRSCDRALWYSFRWCTRPNHDARLLRVFARGHREEENLSNLLRRAGVTVMQTDPNTGKQFTFGNGHFGGSMDGACVNLPDAPKTWHVLEFKTSSAKMFNILEAKGVKEAKPEHWAQMQCYMAWSGMERALYMTVCKDDDRLHMERIDADPQAARLLFERAQRIIDAPTPPEGISTDPSWYECKWCEHADLCHRSMAPVPTCRSCSHSTPEPGGTWTCARHSNKPLTVKEQKDACQAHRVIPILLKNWADPVDANVVDNWVRYQLKEGERFEFTNGTPPDGFTSDELYSLKEKSMLQCQMLLELRAQYDGRLVA
jgi:hypothetical protein